MNAFQRILRGLADFFSSKQNTLAGLIVGLFIGAALSAPLLAPPLDRANPSGFKVVGNPLRTVLPQPPSAAAPLGTTAQQDDIFYTLIWGTRTALRFGLIVTFSTAIFGVLLGAISAYVGGLLNGLIMRVTDAFLTFPVAAGVLLLNRLFVSDINELFAPPTQFHAELTGLGLNTIMLTLILFSWMPYARLINANVQQLKRADFVLAARSVGAKPGRILFRHLLPNAIAPAIVLLARDVGGMVILDAAFAFIGLEGTVEWGQLLVANRDWIIGIGGNPFTYWWVFVPITLALLLFGIGWNLLGDGLNRALNPRKR